MIAAHLLSASNGSGVQSSGIARALFVFLFDGSLWFNDGLGATVAGVGCHCGGGSVVCGGGVNSAGVSTWRGCM